MKKIGKLVIAFIMSICFSGQVVGVDQIMANSNTQTTPSVQESTEIFVPEDISDEDLKNRINEAFENTGAEIVITNYIPNETAFLNQRAGSNYVENKRSFSFLSYAYTIDIIVGGYIVGGYSVSGFNFRYAVSNSIIVVNNYYYQNPTSLSATAIIYFTLNGQVPHTYKCVAPLQGTIYLES